jgi:hypothetical protein
MTKLERELLTECEAIAIANGLLVADVLRDCHRFWTGAGRSLKPRGWAARAAAAARLIARMHCIAEHATAGVDAAAEIDGFDGLTAVELRDEVTYLADYQG